MEALEIIRRDNGIDKFQSFIHKNDSVLVVSENGFQVILYHMPKNLVGILDPLDEGIVETYSILEGKIKLIGQNEENTFDRGDSFTLKGTPYAIPFQVIDDLTLVVSTNSMNYLSDKEKNKELTKIMNDLQNSDGDTKDHCERVKELGLSMIRYIPYDYAKLENFLYAARFHDCGKIHVPLEILVKPAKLNQQEYEIMKTHPYESYKIVKNYFGDDIANIVLQHHERLDGKGYPYGLYEDDICIEAKIIAVADAFDAMVTTRPYNKGKSVQEAVDELIRNIGTQFDKTCVQALIQHLKNKNLI